MAESTKQMPINGGFFVSELKNILSLPKTRRTITVIYGFMFAFVAFTVFMAFSPSYNSSSPWISNIFSGSSSSSSYSYRSQFAPFFSYFFPNSSSPSPKLDNQTRSSDNITFQSTPSPQNLPIVKNLTQIPVNPHDNEVFKPNQTNKQPSSLKNITQSVDYEGKILPASFPATLGDSGKNSTQNTTFQSTTPFTQNPVNPHNSEVLKPNQTNIQPPILDKGGKNLKPNRTASLPAALGDSGENKTQKGEKGVEGNYSASLVKKQSNGTNSSASVKQGNGNWVESLMNCNLFDGEWVKDDSYPLYKPGSCSLIDEQFNCIGNGRPDKDYQKLKWKPRGCILPRLNGSHMLDLLKGKRLVFVGDSLNRNMWESLVCILRNAAKDRSKVFEKHGRHNFRGETSYAFIFKDYSCSIEFFVSPFLVQEWEMADKNGSKKETLRLDLVGRSCDQYKSADIIIFNTGHWWTHEKTAKGKDYYQEGSHVYGDLNVLEAFRKALTTWARWVDANVNPRKSLVFFRGYSSSHFSGGQWNSGGACDSESEPIKNKTYLAAYPPKMRVLERVLKNMKTHVTFLNITRLTDYRKDGHPSIYRKERLSEEEKRAPLKYQDCSHWCLPGVPDAWNELLYAELLVRLYQNQLQQEKKRS